MKRLFDTSVDVKLRQFFILAFAGCLGNICGFVSNIFIYGFSVPTFLCGICSLIVIASSIWGICFGHYRHAAYVILGLLALVEFPMLFYVYNMTTIVYMVLGIVGIVTFMPVKPALFMSVLSLIVDISVILYAYLHPLEPLGNVFNDKMYSTIVSLIIVSFSVFFMTIMTKLQNEKQDDELKRLNKQIERAANLDALTNLYNRRYLNRYLEDIIASGDCDFYISIIDLDYFKKLNDTYGHMFGDKVLVEFGKMLIKHMDGKGIAARFGGEEFILVFRNVGEDVIRKTLEDIRRDYKSFIKSENNVDYSFSSGVEKYTEGTDVSSLYTKVDEKLYKSKNASRGVDTF